MKPAFTAIAALDAGPRAANLRGHAEARRAPAAPHVTVRTFRDARGVEWRVYALLPKGVERRNRTDRRRGADPNYSGPERRRQQDRRGQPREATGGSPQGWILPGLEGGWLVFDSRDARKRLTPIPAEWETVSEAELARLCDAALLTSTSGSFPRFE